MSIPDTRNNNMPQVKAGDDDKELISILTSSLYPGAQVSSAQMVLAYCRAANLDPMLKPVHIVPMWDGKLRQMRDVVMPGIGLYRTIAARSGCYAGVTEPEFGPEVTEMIDGVSVAYPEWCKVTVKRLLSNGVIAEFCAVERWKENYAPKGGQEKSIAPNAMWLKRPYAQLAKCTEAQALRKAMPEVGATPTSDEMEGRSYEEIEVNPAAKPAPDAAPTSYPDADFEKNMPAWERLISTKAKTIDEVLDTLASSTKGALTSEQVKKIKAIKVMDSQADAIEGEIV